MAQPKRAERISVSAARHGRLKRSATWANVAKVLLTTALVFAISGVSVAAYAIWGVVSEANTIDLTPVSDEPMANAVGAGKQSLDGELTILLVGSDSRQGQTLDDGEEGELNDVNLLLHVPADHQSATIISFPRDLMVPIPSCPGPNGEPNYYSSMSEQQLNSSMMYGGLPCVAETISALSGIDIPYAAMVTFDGVINITNAIGGVEVCLSQPLVDSNVGLDLPAGNVSLQGYDALQFLRTRYGVGDGSDVSRISNQQVYMSSLLRQLRSAETLTNPVKVYSLAKAGFESLTLSSSMASIEFMQALAGTVVDIDLDRVNFVQYPSSTHPYEAGRLTPNRFAGSQLMDVVLSGEPFEIAGTGTGAVVAETPEPEVPVEGETAPEGEATPAEPAAPEVVVLPESITGQSASDVTCSAGRTRW
ncbi:MAG: hypothetical protein GX814_03345 [Microbacteriaceae bacterium]|nr:hypothetical protein [Microbacteriaceae bacterium]